MLAVPTPSGQSVSVLGEVVALVAGCDAPPDEGGGSAAMLFQAAAESGVAGREGRDRTPGGGAEGALALLVAPGLSAAPSRYASRLHGVNLVPAARACARLCVFRL